MSRQYDAQLIESVAVRRRRLREAWLFGEERFRHTLDEGVTKLFASVAVAATICAGCVGWSFLQRDQAGHPQPVGPNPSTAMTSGSTPTAPMSTSPFGR